MQTILLEIADTVVLPLVFVLIGGAISYWVSHRLGRKSGSFKRRAIDLLLYRHYSLLHRPLDHVVVGYSPEISPGDLAICYLPITIINTGDLSAEEIVVNWKIPSLFRDVWPAEEHMKQGFTISKEPIARKVTTDDKSTIISYVIPKLDPNVAVVIREYVNIAVCRWPFAVPATTKDQVRLAVTGTVDIKIPIEISISATDIAATLRAFLVQAHPAETHEQLSTQVPISPDLEGMKRDLKRSFPKTPDSKVEEVAKELTSRGVIPHMAGLEVITKLTKKGKYGNVHFLEEDTTQSQVAEIIGP